MMVGSVSSVIAVVVAEIGLSSIGFIGCTTFVAWDNMGHRIDRRLPQPESIVSFRNTFELWGHMQFGVIRFRVERAAAGYELIYRKGDVETRLFESMNSKGRNADHKFANLLDRARGLYIVPRGEPIKGLDIALREHDVFRDLANTEPTPNGALSFTHKWGLLRSGGELSVHEFLKTRTKMEWSLDETGATLTRGKSNYYFGSLCIAKEKGNIVFRACELSQFCWLERFQALEGKVDFSRCRNCTTFLPIDKLGRPQLYCSDRCKQAFYRKGKRDAV